jgi:SAM-dependent methyltransferase
VTTQDRLRWITGELTPEALLQTVWQCLRGEISPAIAITRLLIHTEDRQRVAELLDVLAERVAALPSTSGEGRQAAEMHRLFRENQGGCERIAQLLRGGMNVNAVSPSPAEGIARIAQLCDWAVRQSEEASVALYSLGDPQLLREATTEVIALLDQWGVLGPERSILQIGCGIGRFEAALASRVREVHGIDVAPGMVEAARLRCRGLGNVHIQPCSGRDLGLFESGAFDLVYAVDTFPYLYQEGPGLIEGHFAEVARVLKPGGDFVILNLTYRGNPEADRLDVRRLSQRHGFDVVVDGSYPFRLWDGRAWRMRWPQNAP